MLKKILRFILIVVILLVVYFIAMPVPIDPVAWTAPPNPGYTGAFAVNERLKGIETFKIGNNQGPEDIALDSQGRIYASTHAGNIVRLQADGSKAENWVNTGGRPLGIDFDTNENLIVTDAYLGLLSIDPSGKITQLATEADGIPIKYADDVDVAADGKIYFSDASTKFGAQEFGGPNDASLLELMEHGLQGRLLVFDPATGETKTLLDGLSFANGVAVAHDQTYVLINDMGEYRVIRYWIEGPKKGQHEPFIEALPSFPDNISTGLNGRYWVAFVSPRNKLLDDLSNSPFMRKVIQRLPAFMRPQAVPYGHIIALDENGKVVQDLQDQDGTYPINTSITETEDFLYIGSLVAPVLGRLPKAKAGL
ncbi:MAG: SMP-30/gluconolactonase/LRE family protein [Deltaproteobacteria bacterium]|nr:SMP-30/gluconolactonase/LRE family protein [Deltaproteobacteria bacterium]MBT4639598.1 SMP-30/gluconolactonase/LRE family protein [Deltaproteobacteria bacterium]MBT6615979.1 SMP-30/gluconolactonase/LRE family protein [Deltaproteobacteria bacterium]MBT7153318.1 SMP-30/gluconolactonase/LRE family protein [Deltaproteobacteria bacterium]MBT7715624.1 SMP-30/gluconolactonase/LRE family protein [Deltaproteobacteria bacterium]